MEILRFPSINLAIFPQLTLRIYFQEVALAHTPREATMAKKRAREADGAAEDPDKMVEDGDSSDEDEVSLR